MKISIDPRNIVFRSELEDLQKELGKYAKALAEIANVEDISDIDIGIFVS